ncbi:hypothetical protein DSO57_1023286 [Entomophthora muscae]|uniref:Uncharacterized protein n=1 Tax=Entomophthora muscae TaxID=34485 RepID=A0ACC2SG63_9FUNG|nr:hypothetical protein DSO57_1023286 [Entomophthora muscae]
MLHSLVIALFTLPSTLDAKPTGNTSPYGMFRVQLSCPAADGRCTKFQASIDLVNQFFENAFAVAKTINVQVKVIGASHRNMFSDSDLAITEVNYILDSTPVINLPVALDKQLRSGLEDEIDFVVNIDRDFSYYFPDEFGTRQDGYAILDVLAHEFLHGMGFGVLLDTEHQRPVPYYEISQGVQPSHGTIQFYTNIFMDNVYSSNNEKLTKLIYEMNTQNQIPLAKDKHETPQLLSFHQLKIAQLGKLVTTPKELHFKTIHGNNVLLYTGWSYNPGASISHLDASYIGTQEMLMTSSGHHRTGVHNAESNCWNTSPFGPLTLEIMETLGYKLNPNPSFENSLHGFKSKKKSTKPSTNLSRKFPPKKLSS